MFVKTVKIDTVIVCIIGLVYIYARIYHYSPMSTTNTE